MLICTVVPPETQAGGVNAVRTMHHVWAVAQ
jgi:hypothetical protein